MARVITSTMLLLAALAVTEAAQCVAGPSDCPAAGPDSIFPPPGQRPPGCNHKGCTTLPTLIPTWTPTYAMNQSTVIMPCNYTGPTNPSTTAGWKYLDFDWSNWKGKGSADGWVRALKTALILVLVCALTLKMAPAPAHSSTTSWVAQGESLYVHRPRPSRWTVRNGWSNKLRSPQLRTLTKRPSSIATS